MGEIALAQLDQDVAADGNTMVARIEAFGFFNGDDRIFRRQPVGFFGADCFVVAIVVWLFSPHTARITASSAS